MLCRVVVVVFLFLSSFLRVCMRGVLIELGVMLLM